MFGTLSCCTLALWWKANGPVAPVPCGVKRRIPVIPGAPVDSKLNKCLKGAVSRCICSKPFINAGNVH